MPKKHFAMEWDTSGAGSTVVSEQIGEMHGRLLQVHMKVPQLVGTTTVTLAIIRNFLEHDGTNWVTAERTIFSKASIAENAFTIIDLEDEGYTRGLPVESRAHPRASAANASAIEKAPDWIVRLTATNAQNSGTLIATVEMLYE